jgi:hypothetical protein
MEEEKQCSFFILFHPFVKLTHAVIPQYLVFSLSLGENTWLILTLGYQQVYSLLFQFFSGQIKSTFSKQFGVSFVNSEVLESKNTNSEVQNAHTLVDCLLLSQNTQRAVNQRRQAGKLTYRRLLSLPSHRI